MYNCHNKVWHLKKRWVLIFRSQMSFHVQLNTYIEGNNGSIYLPIYVLADLLIQWTLYSRKIPLNSISKIFYESKLKRLKHYFSSILIKLYHCVQCWQQLLYLLHHIAETYISLSFSRIIHFKFTSRENGFSIQFFFYSKL